MKNLIDWEGVLDIVASLPGHDVTMDPDNFNTSTPGYAEIYKLWVDAGVDPKVVKWTNYYPNKDFDQSIESSFAEQVGVTPLRSWISRIDPGYSAPYHYDVDDNEQEYVKVGKLKRFTCFIHPCVLGQIMYLEDKYYYNQPVGTIVEWSAYNSWHGAMIAGKESYYLFHLLGY